MLAHVGRDNRFVFGELIKLLDDELRLDDFVILIVSQRMAFPPLLDLLESTALSEP